MESSNNITSKAKVATKWSVITEIVAKIISPITNMVLARLLTPEAFGIVATITMIISFAEIFTDAGFQKYLIQHEFVDERDRTESTNVAFWSNLIISFAIWGLIAIFNEPISNIVGNPGLGSALVFACGVIPLGALSSIQIALYKRDFDFKTLFKVRIVGIIIPLVVTIPLAFYYRNFWALICGIMAQNIVNAVLLTCYSRWKPRLFYSKEKLKEMMSFTVWSMFEAISIWLTGYVDVFIVGTMLSQYYLGIYKTSTTIVSQIMSLIIAATTPILFSSLSRYQNDETQFKKFFYKFQQMVGMLVIPAGVGIYCYSDLITTILLGDQWSEASGFIGVWGLTSSLTIVLSHYASEVYRSKGKPRLSALSQWLHIIVLWPTILISVNYGFEVLYISRSWIRMELVLVNLIIMSLVFHFSISKMFVNIARPLVASLLMAFFALWSKQYCTDVVSELFMIIPCIIIYSSIIFTSQQYRDLFLKIIKR